MRKKVALIVQFFDENLQAKTIECYLSERDFKEYNFCWRYDFKEINNKNTDVKEAIDRFYMSLQELYSLGYQFKFVCYGIDPRESD